MLKLGLLRMGLPAMKEFREPSTKLEFDEFEGVVADGGHSDGESTDNPSVEDVDKGGKEED